MTDRPAKTAKSQRTKAAILKAAQALFADQGYERATVRDIAARAAIDPAMVIRYFGSKEALFAEATAFDLKLPNLQIPRAKLTGVQLINCDLSAAKVNECDFFAANLAGTKFVGADCRDSDFRGANLMGADFSEAILSGTDFREGVSVAGATLGSCTPVQSTASTPRRTCADSRARSGASK